jgi:excisionase family DNA binding protein
MKKVSTLIERPAGKAAAAQARKSLDALRKHSRPSLAGTTPPAAAVAAFKQILQAMAQGDGVAVLPLDAELTTQQAADLLGVSRPSLIKLLEEGAIAFRTLGVHRRLKAADVFAYRKTRDAKRRRILDKMVAENQRLGFYDD